MKKTLAIGVAVLGMAAGAYAQGIVQFMNTDNTSSSITAVSGGLVFLNGSLITPAAGNFNVELLGGTSSGNLAVLINDSDASQSIRLGVDSNAGGAGNGTFLDASGGNFIVPGASGTAFFQVLAWTGTATTYAAAIADPVHNPLAAATAVFSNPVVPVGSTTFVPTLTGMPALNLVPVPEPGTFALAGLGAAAMLIFRRRK